MAKRILSTIMLLIYVATWHIRAGVSYARFHWHNRRANFIKNYHPSTESVRAYEQDNRNRMSLAQLRFRV